LQVPFEPGVHGDEEWRSERCRRSLFERKEGRVDPYRGGVESFSWLEPRSRTIGTHRRAREFERRKKVVASTRSMVNERMSDVEHIMLLMSLQREMTEMKRKNGEEILALWRENDEMKRKLAEGGPFGGLGNPVGKSLTTPTGTKTVEEPKPTHTQEGEGESYLNRSNPTTNTLDIPRRHPFTDYMMGAQLLIMWKGLNIDRYEGR